MTVLAPREMEVLSAYFGLDGTNHLHSEEIGDMFGLTRERVRQKLERKSNSADSDDPCTKNSLKSHLG